MIIKRIFVYMVVILLIVKSPIIAYAESAPGTVTVEGGSIGSGGVEGNSTALKGTALAVVMTTLASVGIQVKLAADDYARGNSAFNYIEDKFNQWEAQSDAGWEAYNQLNSTKVGTNGELYVNEAGSSIMQKFINWLYANEQISDLERPGEGTYQPMVNETLYANSFSWVNANNVNCNYTVQNNEKVAFIQIRIGGNYYIGAYSNENFILNLSNGIIKQSSHYNNWYYYVNNGDFERTRIIYENLKMISSGTSVVSSIRNYLDRLTSFQPTEPAPDVITQTGLYSDNTDIPQLVDETGNGKILIVQPGLIGQVQDAYIGSNNATIGIQDYLDALRDLYGQQAIPQEITDLPDITIPGEDAITGTKEEVAVIDRDVVLAPDITVPADPGAITWPEVPETAVAVTDPSIPAEPEISIPAMTVDLTKIFPFCLPWDLYNLLSKFNADPVTPSITIDWGNILGSVGVDFETTLDLHDYDGVAQVLRTMETVAFIIGLAVATRSIFLQS